VEISDLEEVEQAQLMTEISRVARALKEITKCESWNIAASAIWCRNCTCMSSRDAQRCRLASARLGVMPPLAHDPRKSRIFISALRRKIWLG